MGGCQCLRTPVWLPALPAQDRSANHPRQLLARSIMHCYASCIICDLLLTGRLLPLLQYAMLASFLAQHGFAPPAGRDPTAETAMPAAALDECRAIVAGVMAACRRLTIAEGTDAEELLGANFQQ